VRYSAPQHQGSALAYPQISHKDPMPNRLKLQYKPRCAVDSEYWQVFQIDVNAEQFYDKKVTDLA